MKGKRLAAALSLSQAQTQVVSEFPEGLPKRCSRCPFSDEDRELSRLVKWSQASRAMWLHMLLSSGFKDQRSFPFTQLRLHLRTEKWAKYKNKIDNGEELEAFAASKVIQLDEYDECLEKKEEDKALVDSGRMAKEEFIANALRALSCLPIFLVTVNNERETTRNCFIKRLFGSACGLRSQEKAQA